MRFLHSDEHVSNLDGDGELLGIQRLEVTWYATLVPRFTMISENVQCPFSFFPLQISLTWGHNLNPGKFLGI